MVTDGLFRAASIATRRQYVNLVSSFSDFNDTRLFLIHKDENQCVFELRRFIIYPWLIDFVVMIATISYLRS